MNIKRTKSRPSRSVLRAPFHIREFIKSPIYYVYNEYRRMSITRMTILLNLNHVTSRLHKGSPGSYAFKWTQNIIFDILSRIIFGEVA